MEISRAFIVALKIIAVDFIFVILMLLLYYSGNSIVMVIGSLILLGVIIAVAVFFILKEAENMIVDSLSVNKIKNELAAEEEAKSSDKALNQRKSDTNEKSQSTINKSVDNHKQQGYLNPEIHLEPQMSQIKKEKRSRQNQGTSNQRTARKNQKHSKENRTDEQTDSSDALSS